MTEKKPEINTKRKHFKQSGSILNKSLHFKDFELKAPHELLEAVINEQVEVKGKIFQIMDNPSNWNQTPSIKPLPNLWLESTKCPICDDFLSKGHSEAQGIHIVGTECEDCDKTIIFHSDCLIKVLWDPCPNCGQSALIRDEDILSVNHIEIEYEITCNDCAHTWKPEVEGSVIKSTCSNCKNQTEHVLVQPRSFRIENIWFDKYICNKCGRLIEIPREKVITEERLTRAIKEFFGGIPLEKHYPKRSKQQ